MADKSRFFKDDTTDIEPLTDVEHLRHWSRKITVWIEHSNDRLRKLEGLAPSNFDQERDHILCNSHVRVMFRPNKDELAALMHLAATQPTATQVIRGQLLYAEHWFDRLSEGPGAGETLNDAMWELRDALDAAVAAVGGKRAAQKSGLGGEAAALACLIDHPEWSDKRIAKAIGLSRTSLYRYEHYKAAREMLKDSGKGALPEGYKTQDGRIEAY